MSLSAFQRLLRQFVKRFVYSQLYMREAIYIILGWSRPLIRFTVEATPPSVYFNFAVKPERLEGIQAALGLPFPVAPIRCVDGEDPFHCLTLNVYRVSGLANGIRAEWSLYIREPGSHKPRYLVVEAVADAGSMDPVSIITRRGEVAHVRTADGLSTEVGSAGGGRFTASCQWPEPEQPVRAAPEWVEANDLIYWMNGLCDRSFYDSGMANARTIQLNPTDVKLSDTTGWGDWVDPTPRSVIVYKDAIPLVLSPWWNVDERDAETQGG